MAAVEADQVEVEVDLMVEGVVPTNRTLIRKITKMTTRTKLNPKTKAMKLLPVQPQDRRRVPNVACELRPPAA